MTLIGPTNEEAPPCGMGSPHDFYAIEDQVVPPIIAWIRAHPDAATIHESSPP